MDRFDDSDHSDDSESGDANHPHGPNGSNPINLKEEFEKIARNKDQNVCGISRYESFIENPRSRLALYAKSRLETQKDLDNLTQSWYHLVLGNYYYHEKNWSKCEFHLELSISLGNSYALIEKIYLLDRKYPGQNHSTVTLLLLRESLFKDNLLAAVKICQRSDASQADQEKVLDLFEEHYDEMSVQFGAFGCQALLPFLFKRAQERKESIRQLKLIRQLDTDHLLLSLVMNYVT